MRLTIDNSSTLPAWGVSLALHGGVAWLALLFTAQLKPALNEEIFKWDVALVEAVNTDSVQPTQQPAAEPTPQVVTPVHPSSRVAESQPGVPPSDTVVHRIAPRQTVQMVHPEFQPPKPVQQREEPPPMPNVETPTPVTKPLQEKPIEPVEQQIVESPKRKSEPVTATEAEPHQTFEPLIAERQPAASPSEPTVNGAVETPAMPSAPEPRVASSANAERAPAVASSASPVPQEAPMQVAKAAPAPDVKADHRWVAESLWRRVAELKRYPSSARLNGQEGKVIVRAVIRSDGYLAEVSVQKSSGHTILDTAAIESVKLAFPLEMKHAITKSEIVVSLPIVYSLAN